jgi:hypothetical protein
MAAAAAIISIGATLASTAMTLVGGMQAANAQKDAGSLEQASRERMAKQLELSGQGELASAQRRALEVQRQTRLVQSQLQARAASQGAGATDPTVVQLGEDISARGEYQNLLTMWEGKNSMNDSYEQARAQRFAGEVAQISAKNQAKATMLASVGGALSSVGRMASSFQTGGSTTGTSTGLGSLATTASSGPLVLPSAPRSSYG